MTHRSAAGLTTSNAAAIAVKHPVSHNIGDGLPADLAHRTVVVTRLDPPNPAPPVNTPLQVSLRATGGPGPAASIAGHPMFVKSYRLAVATERITVDPAHMDGRPCIRGMRVTAAMILGQLAGDRTVDEVLADYPYLEQEDVLAALRYAAAVVDQREATVTRPA